MKTHRLLGFLAIVGFIILGSAVSQGASGGRTITGTVKEVIQNHGGGTHVVIDHQGESVEICLGQSRFLEANDSMPKVGDGIRVQGFMLSSGNGDPLFVAQSIREGSRDLELFRSGSSRGCGCHNGGFHHHGGHCGHGGHGHDDGWDD